MAGKRQASGNTCRRYEWPTRWQVGARPKVRMADIRAGKVVQASARARAQPLSTSGVGRDAGVEDCIPQFVPKVKTALKDSKGAYVIQ